MILKKQHKKAILWSWWVSRESGPVTASTVCRHVADVIIFIFLKTIYLYDVTVNFWGVTYYRHVKCFSQQLEQKQKHEILEHFKSRKSFGVPIESPR